MEHIKRILSFTRRAIDDYQMIEPGDRIAVGVSAGKDSLTLLCAMAQLRRFYPVPFELIAITIDMGFEGTDFSPIAKLCEQLDVPYHIIPTEISKIIFDVRREKNPCSLCAKMRRGALNNAAKKLADEGMTLSYHNHTHEFLPLGELCGERYIFDNAPLLNLQLDVGHATAAKVDPVEWIERYSDRIVTAHYKDTLFDDEGKRRDMPIGEGWVNWEKVTAALLKTGCEAFIVEHEEFPRDIWDILQTSYNNIAGFLGQAK